MNTKTKCPTYTIIMIHGFRGTHHGLKLISDEIKKLPKNNTNFQIIIPDLPGFGVGEKLNDYSLEGYINWLDKFIDNQKSKTPLVLVGHSFGTIICSAYAAKYGQKISKLILINPIGAPALQGPNKLMANLTRLYYQVGSILPKKLALLWLSSRTVIKIMTKVLTKSNDKILKNFIYNQHYKYFSKFHDANSLLQIFKVSINYNVSNFAEKIKNKTLLIAGALDDITPLKKQQLLAKKFKSAKLKVINNVGHLTHYETPAIVAKYIYDFIKSL